MGLPGKILLVSFLTAFVAAGASAPEPAAQAPKHILVLYDEDKDNFPGLASIDRSVRESFESGLGPTVDIHSESLDLSQFDRPGSDSRVAGLFRRKSAREDPS